MTGAELKELRSRLGMTQAALALEVGVAANTLARWERGKSSIPDAADKLIRDMVEQQTTARAISWSQSVIRDPHHQSIIAALNGKLDPDVFEVCAADLLKSEWPSLVSVVGGSDDGYDGAVASVSGDPFPLITTTSSRVKDNIERNLKRAISGGWSFNHAIFATSRRITPATRKKLFTVARESGIQLRQVYDQDWFANALYREPSWCKRLLGLTGRPSALSVYPISRRPILGDKIYGREKEIQLLRDIDRDCIVVGGPGSGKTFLLRALALEGRALFLVDLDREAIANAIREQKPPAVIVDDAQLDEQQLVSLAQLRSEINADFKIIAVSWPAEAKKVASALSLASSDFIDLDLIDADTMVEVIKSAGIYGPNVLISSIVRQAEGRPGLAVTLVYLCLHGDVQDVLSGEALADQIGQLIPDELGLLGVFGLGGKAGVSRDLVSRYLGIPRYQVSSALARLAAAGVVREARDDSISVWPAALRWVLVRNAFFGGPGSYDNYFSLFQELQDKAEAVETLIGARARGAVIPGLEEILESMQSPSLWSEYASLGPRESDLVVRKHPELAVQLASTALYNAPDIILPLLFEQARGDRRPLHNTLDHPLRKIQDWATGASPVETDVISLRKTLIEAAKSWWQKSQITDIAVRAMCIALDPGFDATSTDPGRGRTITITTGLLRDIELSELSGLWPIVLEIINSANDIPWTELFNLLHKWLHPRLRVSPEETTRNLMQIVANGMLQDLANASVGHPGIQHHIAEIAERAEQKPVVSLNPDFEILYPLKDFGADEEKFNAQAAAARELGEKWSNEYFVEVASRIAWIEVEASLAGLNYPRFTNYLCAVLAKTVTDPVDAANQLIDLHVPSDLIEPFLMEGIRQHSDGWRELIHGCLDIDMYRGVSVATLIVTPDIPDEFIDIAITHAKNYLQLIDACCLRGEVPERTLEKLLDTDIRNVALAAAVGYWNAVRRDRMPDKFQKKWRKVIAESNVEDLGNTQIDYWVGEILSKDADLAHAWLINLMKQNIKYLSYEAGEVAEKAIQSLGATQRNDVLAHVQESYGNEKIVRKLVGKDVEVYQFLIGINELSCYHLSPLEGPPEEDWYEKALVALDAGYSPDEIARATLPSGWSWTGRISNMWSDWNRMFVKLQEHPDARISRIGIIGAQITGEWRDRSIEEERIEDIRGI